MSSFMTKWSVEQQHPVTGRDLDLDGVITDQALEQWVDLARSAYVDQCTELAGALGTRGLELRCTTGPLPDPARRHGGSAVVVTATATEVFPASFVVAVRLRPIGGDRDGPLDITSVVELVDPATGVAVELGNAVRDELISLEHAARHYN